MKKGEKEGHIHQRSHRKVKKGELEREKKRLLKKGLRTVIVAISIDLVLHV